MTITIMTQDKLKRWRLILGNETKQELEVDFNKTESGIDRTLEALYNTDRKGGLGPSSPNVARWLGDIREYFPNTVVKVMQQDALKRLHLTSMLTEPEMLEAVVPDIHLVANLMTLGGLIPNKTKATARMVVKKVVDELIKKLAGPTQQAVVGSLNRAAWNMRPRHNEINWKDTIKKNLKHYQPEYKTIIPETLSGYGRRRKALKDIVLCIDQSGSMGTSVVYSGIFGAVMASIPAVHTKMVVFDTEVVDLTEELKAELADKYESLFPFKTPYKENEQFNKEQIERRKQFVEAATSDIAKKIHTQGYISIEEHRLALAEAQLLGYFTGDRYPLTELLINMGLKREEWEVLIAKYEMPYMRAEDMNKIEEFINNK